MRKLGIAGAVVSGIALAMGCAPQKPAGDPSCIADGSFEAEFHECTGKVPPANKPASPECLASCRKTKGECCSGGQSGACEGVCTDSFNKCNERCKM